MTRSFGTTANMSTSVLIIGINLTEYYLSFKFLLNVIPRFTIILPRHSQSNYSENDVNISNIVSHNHNRTNIIRLLLL